MIKSSSLLCLVIFTGISYAFDRDAFLSKCSGNIEIDSKDFDECLLCEDIKLEEEDLKEFQEQSFNITNEECIIFGEGDLGVVNGDFFKQFPNAKFIVFEGGRFSLASGSDKEGNDNLETIRIEHSHIDGDEVSGAFDNLSNLTTLTMEHVELKNQSLLKNLLENLDNLKALTICGPLEEFPIGIPSTIEEVTICDFLFNQITKTDLKELKNLKILSIYTGNLETIDENAFDDLELLEELDLEYNRLEKFPVRHLQKNKNIKRVALDPVDHPDLTEVGLWETSRTGYFVKEDEVKDYDENY